VPTAEQEWADRVQHAAMAGDSGALKELFDEGTALFGARASHLWADTLSAFDSSAVTG
jgi:hypothetical protein